MQQQPAQTGQSSIPAPPQYGLHPYPQMPQPPLAPSRHRPYPPELYTYLYQQFARSAYPAYGAPYPVPPQNGGGYPPAFPGTGVPAAAAPAAAALPSHPSAPSLVQPSRNQHSEQALGQQQTPAAAPPSYPFAPSLIQPSHNQHSEQGLGQQQTPAAALPSYPFAPSLVEPSHNQHSEQGLGQQQTPVAAAGQSAVRRGKRKAVDLDDDAPPQKKQSVHPFHPDFELVQNNGELRYKCRLPQCENVAAVLYVSIQGHIKSKRHQKSRVWLPSQDCDKAVSHGDDSTHDDTVLAEQWKQFIQNIEQMADSTSSGLLAESLDSLEETVDSASGEPLEKLVNSLEETIDSASGAQLDQSVNSLEETVDSASGGQSEDFINTVGETIDSASGGQSEDFINSVGETVDSASGEQLEESPNSPDETNVWHRTSPNFDSEFDYFMNTAGKPYVSPSGESMDDLVE
ncbi:hypothetical protein EV702DRAFT_1283736 [Suillus placidus]|uniref:Uncharacterized protein n=1 Tax=Suillus placidus TaxID=48579 RepID=A0A9P6ZFY7_9AGAM|nr:hypothetical protein EV702DRAFT_1283736 [Suillus placidus]